MSKPFIESHGVAIASPGCCRKVKAADGHELLCSDPIAWTGTYTTTVGNKHTDTVYACDGHEEILDDRRPFDDAIDHQGLERWIRNAMNWLFEPWPGFREGKNRYGMKRDAD